jgi:hypothetical protein
MERNSSNRLIRSLVWALWELIRDALPRRREVLDHLRCLGAHPNLKGSTIFSKGIAYRKLHNRRLPPMVGRMATEQVDVDPTTRRGLRRCREGRRDEFKLALELISTLQPHAPRQEIFVAV